MRRATPRPAFIFFMGLTIAATSSAAFGQSGTRGSRFQGSGTRVTSGPRIDPNLAMRGYCAVCLREMKKWVKGSPEHRATLGGKHYLFASNEQKEMFVANPLKYAPALNGDCIVTYAATGQRVPANPNYGFDDHGRYFFFATNARKEEFKADHESFADVDLALGGKCAVCLVEMKEEVDGKPEFSAMHDGLRYQFPSDEQLAMFKAKPDKYALPGTQAKASLAMSGYCPVCILEMRKWVKGSPDHGVVFDGQRYLFPSNEQKETFLNDPLTYAPVLAGDCVVCLKEMGKRVPGSVRHAAFSEKRLFLFPSEEQKKMFLDDPDAYADVDIAHSGNCAVCLVEMKETVPGKTDFTLVRNGIRYLFPGSGQRHQFLSDPVKYSVATTAKTDGVIPSPPN